ncbi:CBN-STG-1 protein [Aphelenchoides avenae]|nr:CBN-STG-1 protein [Aphelenchus avenae]
MVLPVIQHNLTKIRHTNRRRLIRTAFCFSTVACASNIISTTTNNWLYTSEVLKYYVFPNRTSTYDDLQNQPTYYKNATFGPWLFCWLDPVTEFHCTKVDLFSTDEPSDVTTSVEQSVRRSFVFMIAGIVLDSMALLSIMLCCCCRRRPYRTLFVSMGMQIFAGLSNFACIIVYMAAVSKEVGNKIYPASEMDDPLFHYSYGYSLICLKASNFLCTETSALFSVLVYMSMRDEKTYTKYHINSMIRNAKFVRRDSIHHDRYHRAHRMTLHRASRCSPRQSVDEPANGAVDHKPISLTREVGYPTYRRMTPVDNYLRPPKVTIDVITDGYI